jgi:hypothetical protein
MAITLTNLLMRTRPTFLIAMCCALLGWCRTSYAQEPTAVGASLYRNDRFGFSIKLDGQVWVKEDTTPHGSTVAYCNSLQEVCLVATHRKSMFRRVEEYVDCSKADLERELRILDEDSTLHVVACYRPTIYSGEAEVLHYTTSEGPFGLNGCIVYFFHHNRKDIQLSFLYKTANSKASFQYIADAIETLKFLD